MLPTLSSSSPMLWFPIMLTQSSISSLYPYISLSAWDLGLGLASWFGGRGGSELGRRAGSVAACVGDVDQGAAA